MTGAHIQIGFVLEACAARGGLNESCPLLMTLLQRIHLLLACLLALERGGEYSTFG